MGVPDEIIITMSEENDILSQFYQYSHSFPKILSVIAFANSQASYSRLYSDTSSSKTPSGQ